MMLLTDLSFILADMLAARWMLGVWQGGDADLFQLLLYSAFIVYGLAARASCRRIGRTRDLSGLGGRFPQLLFLLRLGHVATLLVIPVLLFVASLNGGARGDEWVLTISFLLLPALTVFTLFMVAREPEAKDAQDGAGKAVGIAVRFGMVYAFAFFDTVVLAAGNELAFWMTKELAPFTGSVGTVAGSAPWYFSVPLRLAFIGLVYVPMRLRLGCLPEGSGRAWLPAAVTPLLIVINGVL